jgi:histone-lysine N-methyltransferase SETMAR
VQSQAICMLISFFRIKGIAHKECILTGQTVNSAYYCDVLGRLRENLRRLRPEHKNMLLHQDNVPSHISLFTRELFTERNMNIVSHPPYLPDLTPVTFLYFPPF